MLLSGGLDATEPVNPNSQPAAAPLPLPPLAPMQSPFGYGPAGVGPAAVPPGATPPSPYPYYVPYYSYYVPYYGPPRPRVWTVFVGFFAALAAAIAMQVFAAGLLAIFLVLQNPAELASPQQVTQLIQERITDPDIILLLLLATQIGVLAVAVGGAWLSPIPLPERLRLRRSTVPVYGYPLVALGATAIGILFEVLVYYLHLPESKDLKFLNDALQHLTPWQAIGAVLVVGGAPAFAEEWFFRGYMQTRLSARWGRWPAIMITAILFGVMHLNPVQGVFAVLLGIYIGYLAEKSGSVRPGMACHFANNAIQVILARYLAAWNVSETAMTITVGVLAVVLVVAVVYMVFGIRPPPPQVREPALPQPVADYPPPFYAPPPVAWPPAGM